MTQQLVKNLTGDDEATPQRKLREIFRALELERRVGKERILEVYLNVINHHLLYLYRNEWRESLRA